MSNNNNLIESLEVLFSQTFKPITTPHQTLYHSIHSTEKGKSIQKSQNTNYTTPNSFNTLYNPTIENIYTKNGQELIENNFYNAFKIDEIMDIRDISIINQNDLHISFALLQNFQYNTLYEH
ncbi:hypothetical protein C1645_841579 [Glomus cerebriforme]|uniref:Uncharacterized protein n=1 Tax=Glomus cerebriforme TaxID=658196 RepID=A0A397S2P0_9GLOM|nr:hypothetical protein C1645_841579 [Glomus cerebriforme]